MLLEDAGDIFWEFFFKRVLGIFSEENVCRGGAGDLFWKMRFIDGAWNIFLIHLFRGC